MTEHSVMMPDRRSFFRASAHGFGGLAFAALAGNEADGSSVYRPHFNGKAKSVIFLFMEGGPSHVDLFDPKPALTKMHGKPLPASFGNVVTPMGTGGNKLLASKREFKRHGESGTWVSDWLPHMAGCIDEFALLRACRADGLNHVGSVLQMNTGSILAGRPSLGSWVLYGLGSENRDLPGYVVLTDGAEPTGGARNYGTGFMPATFQGTRFRPGGAPVMNLRAPRGVTGEKQRAKLDLIGRMNALHGESRPGDSRLDARTRAYELAYRMQSAAPDAVDLSRESPRTRTEYGMGDKATAGFGRACLMARRLVERGVRFVQIYCGAGSRWDAHGNLEGNHTTMCRRADKPTAALIMDLKRRGLLDETLVIWGGEFGRTPMTEGKDGRDHNPYGFSMLMAGGGVKKGVTHGATDEFGLYAVDGRAHVHDLHATILYLLGVDHKALTFRHSGRDERATVNEGHVVRSVLG